jgi:hypothetical protein
MSQKEKLVWRTETRKVSDLVPSAGNPRTMSDKQLKDLVKSIDRTGYVEPIAIDTDNTIVAGHKRHEALLMMGRKDEEIDVRVPSRKLTPEEFDRYLIASNAVSGSWDFEKLKTFDIDLLLDIGLDDSDLAAIWDQHLEVEDDDFNIDEELEKIGEPKTKPGDLIELGPHKLVCGDATDPAVLAKLFGEERAAMVYSDPVYNLRGGVDYAKGVGGHANYGGSVNDTRTDDEYREFLRVSMENALAVARDDVHAFYWCDESYVWLVQQLYREIGIENKRICLWVKNGQNPTPGVAFSKCYEPVVYGVRGKPYLTKGLESLNEILNKEIGTGNRLIDDILDMWNIWLAKRLPGNEYQHATSKPPELHERAIRRCTKAGDIILDSFGGSGSTLIAAHQLKRKAYLVELEPRFCDLIIARYQRLTENDHEK